MLVSNMIDLWSYLFDNLIKNSIDAKLENDLVFFFYYRSPVSGSIFLILLREHLMNSTWTRRGGRWSKNAILSTFKVKNVHLEVGGCQRKAKLYSHSH